MDTLTFLGEGGNPAFIHNRYIDGGAYGEVHEYHDSRDSSRFARKVIRAFGGPGKRKEIEDMIRNESRVIAKLCGPRTHPNIVVVLRQGSVKDTGMFYFDMEYCEENLGDFIHDSGSNGKRISLVNACSIMRDIAASVAFIHDQGEVHRDLKPRNILYSDVAYCWKIADFGLTSEGSSRLLHTTTASRGTDCYRAPELLQYPKATYNNKVDIWSMGCIMYEIRVGRKPFNNDWEVLKRSESSEPIRFPIAVEGSGDTDLLALISEMLSLDPSYRPAARSLTEKFSAICSSSFPSAPTTSPSNSRRIPISILGLPVPTDFEQFPRILSLDDEGIRGLSSLFILREIMEEIRTQTEATETPLPCQYFDLISGSGTGGLIAIMLGRLRMSVNECIKEYSALSRGVFDFESMLLRAMPPGDECRFHYSHLESALKAVVKRKLTREDAIMADSNTGTRTLILVGDTSLPHSVRLCSSYDANIWCIWQVGCATASAPQLFEAIKVFPPGDNTFAAPGIQFSNPAEIALREASRIWTTSTRSCLVSIGTAPPNPLTSFIEPNWLPSGPFPGRGAVNRIAQHCVDLAQSSMVTHYRLLQLSTSKDPDRPFSYYRFNIQGNLELEEMNQEEHIALRTAHYMRRNSNLNKCVQDLMDSSSRN